MNIYALDGGGGPTPTPPTPSPVVPPTPVVEVGEGFSYVGCFGDDAAGNGRLMPNLAATDSSDMTAEVRREIDIRWSQVNHRKAFFCPRAKVCGVSHRFSCFICRCFALKHDYE